MRRFMISVAMLAILGACSKGADTNAANNAAPANTAAPAAAPANTATAPAGPVPSVTGTYTINGKNVPLPVVVAYAHDPINDKPIVEIIFSAKPQSGASSDPSADSYQFKFGDNSLVLDMHPDGSVYAVDVASKNIKEKNFSATGDSYSVKNLVSSGGVISGELTSGGETGAMNDDKINVDLTFKVQAPAPAPQ